MLHHWEDTVKHWYITVGELDDIWDKWCKTERPIWKSEVTQKEWTSFVEFVYIAYPQYDRIQLIMWKTHRWHEDNRRMATITPRKGE